MTRISFRLASAVRLLHFLFLAAVSLGGCDGETEVARANGASTLPASMLPPPSTNADARPPAVPYDSATPRTNVRPVASWPHDPDAFTQGLVVTGGRLLESTGLKGKSDLREVDRVTGRVRRRTALAASMFGEGIAVVGKRVYQLTWRDERVFVYDAVTLALVDSLSYAGEAWGLTTDGRSLYLSDGTSHVRVISPEGFKTEREFQVVEAGRPVWMLNELEWVRGELWANVYQTDFIARIDPTSGRVIGWLNLSDLLNSVERRTVESRGGATNGIALDSARNRVLLTGKHWPRLFEMDLRSVR